MRIQVLLVAFLFTALSASCQSSSAGVTIPPHQTFILGEYSDYGYKAKLTNKGTQVVTVQLRSKADASVITAIQLSPKQKEALSVAADQIVALANASDTEAEVGVKMSKTVRGMSYQGTDGEEVVAIAPNERETYTGALTVNKNAGPAKARAKATISGGEAFVLGEGTSTSYSAELKTIGGSIKVSIRDRRTNEQTQGFGLGNGGETVNIRPHEVIYLVHDGGIPARVTVDFNQPVSGARVVGVE